MAATLRYFTQKDYNAFGDWGDEEARIAKCGPYTIVVNGCELIVFYAGRAKSYTERVGFYRDPQEAVSAAESLVNTYNIFGANAEMRKLVECHAPNIDC